MNSIHTVLAGTLSSDLNIRNIVIQTLSEACVKYPSLESELLKLTELVASLPSLLKLSSISHPALSKSLFVHIIEFISSNIKRYNVALEIQLPCKECALIWMPWLPHQTQPPRSPGNYNHANMGKPVLLPRKTKSFGASYTFTAQTLEQEPETPPEITALYQETKEIFGLQEGPNACLENDYDCGRNYISEHSDNIKPLGSLKDVYCWVTGPSVRTLTLRVRAIGKRVPASLKHYCGDPENADATRNLMSVLVPAGLYVMRGNRFQERYSHEIPQMHEALLKRVLVMAKKLWYAFPDVVELTEKGASQTGLVQALWVKENKEIVKAAILDRKLNNRNTAKNKTERTDAELVQDFEEWCLERTSYTLRQFASSDVEVLVKTSGSLKRKFDE